MSRHCIVPRGRRAGAWPSDRWTSGTPRPTAARPGPGAGSRTELIEQPTSQRLGSTAFLKANPVRRGIQPQQPFLRASGPPLSIDLLDVLWFCAGWISEGVFGRERRSCYPTDV